MATLKYIRGLTRAGFRVNSSAASGLSKVTLSGTTQVDLDNHKTELVLAGNRNTGAFACVSGSGATTATINALSRRGFRIQRSSDSAWVQAVIGGYWKGGVFTSGPVTVDLTNPKVLRVLLREKRAWYVAADPTAVVVRGIQNEQNGFDLSLGFFASATLDMKSANTNVADGDTVTINDKTYRFKNTMALANDVQIGTNIQGSLGNLILAVNGTGTAGVNYFAGTTQPTDVKAGPLTSSDQEFFSIVFQAQTPGTGGNAYASTETSTELFFANGATFTGGAKAGDSEAGDPVKIYRGVTATIDATQPFNFQQLRRHYDRWIEG